MTNNFYRLSCLATATLYNVLNVRTWPSTEKLSIIDLPFTGNKLKKLVF